MAYMSHTHVTAVRKPDMSLYVKGILRCQPNVKAEARCKLSRLLICCASPRPPGGGVRNQCRLLRLDCTK